MLKRFASWLPIARNRAGGALRRAQSAYEARDLEQALEYCHKALARSPADVEACCLMASIAADRGDIDGGLSWARAALEVDPQAVAGHYALGRLLHAAGALAEAETSYRRVLELSPRHARAYNNLGCVLRLDGRHDEALECFRQALALDPEQAEANQNYAGMSNDPVARERAIQGYRQQIEAEPTDARAYANLAHIYMGQGRWPEAEQALERAIELDPERPDARYSRALYLLLHGDYARGWEEYEWRWRMPGDLGAAARRFRKPMWDGRDLHGGALLVHGELAFGESFQFLRYARLAAACGAKVVWECAPQIKELVARTEGVSQALSRGDPAPALAAHVGMFNFPRMFATSLADTHWNGPYITAAAADLARWSDWFARRNARGLRVGLVWTGNLKNPNNLDRSVPVEALLPVRDVPGVTLYSLQKGLPQRAREQAVTHLALVDATDDMETFASTAAFMAHLDLVVAIDTAVAHLAGAMGRPVWVLLNHAPDWRYHLERADNPWYPTMRLYRQSREGAWAEPVARLAADLARFAVEKTAVSGLSAR